MLYVYNNKQRNRSNYNCLVSANLLFWATSWTRCAATSNMLLQMSSKKITSTIHRPWAESTWFRVGNVRPSVSCKKHDITKICHVFRRFETFSGGPKTTRHIRSVIHTWNQNVFNQKNMNHIDKSQTLLWNKSRIKGYRYDLCLKGCRYGTRWKLLVLVNCFINLKQNRLLIII